MSDLAHAVYLPHLFLTIAAVVMHVGPRSVVLSTIVLAAGCAVLTGGMDFIGVTWLVTLALALRAVNDGALTSIAREISGVMALQFAVLLSDHALPGFRNPVVFTQARFTADAAPFTMYFNFEKVMVGLLITLIFTGERRRAGLSRDDLIYAGKNLALLVTVMLGAAWATGYVGFAPKWPADGWVWMLDNLLFVTLAEEALFRGFVLESLLRREPGKIGRWFAVSLSAVAFGLMHHRGGMPYVALSALAGVFYGCVYIRTRKIGASMLVHFGLNLVHFTLFTYPALARVA